MLKIELKVKVMLVITSSVRGIVVG
jgi:hypothetical protein